MNWKKILVILSLLVLVVLPVVVFAQQRDLIPPSITGLPGNAGSTVTRELGTYINIFLGIIGIIAVAFLIIGGFRYITSAGDSEVAESAKNTILNAVIGLVIVILSYIIVTVIVNAFWGRI